MEVILKENIESLGEAGDVVRVRAGYARNFLLPHKMAVQADSSNLKELEHHKRAAQARQSKLKKEAETLATKIAAVSLTIQKDSGEGDKLFGSVTAKDVLLALRKEGVAVDRRQLQIKTPFKQLGDFDVPVKLHPEVSTTLKVSIVKNEK